MRRRLAIGTGGLLALVVLGLALDRLYPPNVPDERSHLSRVVVDADGDPLRAFPDARGVWRYPVTPAEVSPLYLEALVNYEDRWFRWHPGVNPLALARAAVQNLGRGGIVSGGSTLTMQVARLLHPHERTIGGKLGQMLRALQLEWRLGKQEILTLYLNLAPFGGTLEGVQAASHAYLGKSARRLSHAEAALLAVLPQAPTRLRPDRSRALAQRSRDKVIDRLVAGGTWSEAIGEAAKLEPVPVPPSRKRSHAPLLARRLAELDRGSRIVATTIDGQLQAALADRLREYVETLPARTTASVLVVDNRSLAVKAYLGTAEFGDVRRFGYLDMATAVRSPGSTLKPFLFALALDAGLIHSHSLLADVPRLAGYRPANFDGAFNGPVSAAEALRRSLNVPFVDLIERYGSERFAGELGTGGLRLRIPGGKASAAIVLGGVGTTLEQLVAAYAALARGGKAGPLKYLRSELVDPPADTYWLSPASVWIVGRILRGASEPERPHGAMPRGDALAWKTGTSYGMRDAWAIGAGDRYTVGVWVGRPDGTSVADQGGRATAGPLLLAVAEHLGDEAPNSPRPDAVRAVEICWPLGTARALSDAAHCHERHVAWTIDGHAPPTWHAADRDGWRGYLYRFRVAAGSVRHVAGHCAVGGYRSRAVALWPKVLEPWIPLSRRRSVAVPPSMDGCSELGSGPSGLRIVGLSDGAVYRSLAGSKQAPLIELKAVGARGDLHWYIDGRLRYSVAAERKVRHRLARGTRQVLVQDSSGGSDRVEIAVR